MSPFYTSKMCNKKPLDNTACKVIAGLVFIALQLPIIPAQAQPIIQSLPDGNYYFCSLPPTSERLSEEELSVKLAQFDAICFQFRKQVNTVVGELYTHGAYGEDIICIEGIVNQNSVSGRAVAHFSYGVEYARENPKESIEWIKDYWSQKRVLSITDASYFDESDIPYAIIYQSAILNLKGFYPYNIGTELPPQSCLDKTK